MHENNWSKQQAIISSFCRLAEAWCQRQTTHQPPTQPYPTASNGRLIAAAAVRPWVLHPRPSAAVKAAGRRWRLPRHARHRQLWAVVVRRAAAAWRPWPILKVQRLQVTNFLHTNIYYTSLKSFISSVFLFVGPTILGTCDGFWLVGSISWLSKRYNQ